MKKLIFTATMAFALLFSQKVNAQITLEHTFDGNVDYSTSSYFYPGIDYYTYFNSETNQVRIYNKDYSLYKSITITPPANYHISSVYILSKNVFTNDNKITFFAYFTQDNASMNNSLNNLKLYDENGVVIKDFGYLYSFHPSVHIVSNKYRLSVVRYIYTNSNNSITHETDIYSLPGTVSNNSAINIPQPAGNASPLIVYPNPAKSDVFVECDGFNTVKFYDVSGKEVLTQNAADKTVVNIGHLPTGVYVVNVVRDGRVIGSNKIVKQ